MTPRIQGGRPGPDDTTFHVTLPEGLTPAEMVSVSDMLGPDVWFDDALDGGLFCWCDESVIAATTLGGYGAWWAGLHTALGYIGATAEALP